MSGTERHETQPSLPCFTRANGHNLGRGRVVAVYWEAGPSGEAPRMTLADVELDAPAGFMVERVPIEAIFDADNVAARMIGAPGRAGAAASVARAAEVA